MKALQCIEPGWFEYVPAKQPVLIKDHAIIKITRIGICGTDLHAFEGTQPFFAYPRILGHELAGELVDFDNAPGFTKGETVTLIPYFECNRCIACRHNKPNCCANIKVCGVHIDGGMQEYLLVPSASLVHGKGLSPDELAMVEMLSIGAHGIRRAAVKQHEYVLVMGAGPIGIGVMEFAHLAGAEVIALDKNEMRLQFCKENLEVKHTINTGSANTTEQLLEITHGDMPTVVIDATGNLNAINKGFEYIAHGGRYLLIGLQKANINFSHPEFHKREATLMSSRNATREDFEQVMISMKNRQINATSYITHRVQFENVKHQFKNYLDPANGVIKAMIEL